MTHERRHFTRVNYGEDVLLNRSIKVKALTISEGGLYVHTGRHFPAQSMVDLSLPVERRALSLKAQVRHSQQGIGMGLMFLNLTPEQRLSLKQFVDFRAMTSCETRNRVLIIDDNEMNRRIYKSKLVLDGLTVFEAASSGEALSILQQEKIDLVVINPYLIREDGFGILTAIHTNPPWRDIKLLILATRSTAQDVLKAHEAGVAEYMLKMSTSPVKLSEKVKSHLRC